MLNTGRYFWRGRGALFLYAGLFLVIADRFERVEITLVALFHAVFIQIKSAFDGGLGECLFVIIE